MRARLSQVRRTHRKGAPTAHLPPHPTTLAPSPNPLIPTRTHNMVSAWLSKASTALVCAVAMSGMARSLPSLHGEVQEAVEELHFDKLGNMIWPSDELPALGRPNFDGLNVKAMEAEAVKQSEKWLGKAEAEGAELLEKVHHSFEGIVHEIEDVFSAIEGKVTGLEHNTQDWLHKGQVWMDGMQCESGVHGWWRLATDADCARAPTR